MVFEIAERSSPPSGRHFFACLALMIALSLNGCAASGLKKIDHSQEMPQDVPQDFHRKFEVKDTAATPVASPSPDASPTPAPSPPPVREKKRTKKQQARDLLLAAVGPIKPPPLVYRNLRPEKDPIWIGEKLTYEVTYLGLSAGTIIFEVLPYKNMNGRKVYHIQASVRSSNVFGMIYRLEDSIQTFIGVKGCQTYRLSIDRIKEV